MKILGFIKSFYGLFQSSFAAFLKVSLRKIFVQVKTPMGLVPFEVRLFFRDKFTKFDLASNGVIENIPKLTKKVFIMFGFERNIFLGSKYL